MCWEFTQGEKVAMPKPEPVCKPRLFVPHPEPRASFKKWPHLVNPFHLHFSLWAQQMPTCSGSDFVYYL